MKGDPEGFVLMEKVVAALDSPTLAMLNSALMVEIGRRLVHSRPLAFSMLAPPAAKPKPRPKPNPKPTGRYIKRNLAFWQAKSNGKAKLHAVPNNRGKKKKTA